MTDWVSTGVIQWALVAAVGLIVATVASARAVDHAARAAAGLGIPAFIIGFTLVGVGTDLPEIANSIIASVSGHGDINVGDSIGSAAVQATLVIGVLPFVAKRMRVSRRNVGMLGGLTCVVLVLGATLTADGLLDRRDGLTLVAAWIVSVSILWRSNEAPTEPELPLPERGALVHVGVALVALLFVTAGASLAVVGFTNVAAELALPEFVVSFFGQALGTSLPELVVAITAARRGQGDLALGDALGASLADASLSMGSGPIIASTTVSASLAVRGGLVTAVAVAATTIVLAGSRRHNRITGTVIVLLYVAVAAALATATGTL